MYAVLISLALAAAVTFGLHYPLSVGWVWSGLAGTTAGLAGFVGMAFYANKKMEARMPDVEGALGAQKPDVAIKILEDLRSLDRWQPTAGLAIDGQIGTILYAHKQDADAARPYLEKTIQKNWYAKAMLGAHHYRRKDDDAMRKVFEKAVKSNKKESMLWAAYAWCLWKRRQTDDAIEVLKRAQKVLPDDEAISTNLSALQSGHKMKMRDYEPEWWALLLERPPAQVIKPGRRGAGRFVRRA